MFFCLHVSTQMMYMHEVYEDKKYVKPIPVNTREYMKCPQF